MKIRIQDSLNYIDLNILHPHLFNTEDPQIKQQLEDVVKERELKCSGCGKPLEENKWIVTLHRPKSALNEETGDSREIWSIFFLCEDTSEECCKKWLDLRPK